MTPRQAAERLDLTPRYVCILCVQGRIPAAKDGNDWWLKPEDVEAYRQKRHLKFD